jgi:hypothetical protein
MENSLKHSNVTGADFTRALDCNLYEGADFRDYCQTKVSFLAVISASWLLWPKIYRHSELCLVREMTDQQIEDMFDRGLTAQEIELSLNSFHILDEFSQTGSEFDLELAEECCAIVLKSWEAYLPTQTGTPVTLRRTTFDESYGPTVSFHTQKTA